MTILETTEGAMTEIETGGTIVTTGGMRNLMTVSPHDGTPIERETGPGIEIPLGTVSLTAGRNESMILLAALPLE